MQSHVATVGLEACLLLRKLSPKWLKMLRVFQRGIVKNDLMWFFKEMVEMLSVGSE